MVLEAGGRSRGFGSAAVLEDLSAGGFRLRFSRRVEGGGRVLIVVQVSQALIALRGRVVRAEPQAEGCRLAASVTQYKIFSLPEMEAATRETPAVRPEP